jgi:undecaprenyl-diphosphatase
MIEFGGGRRPSRTGSPLAFCPWLCLPLLLVTLVLTVAAAGDNVLPGDTAVANGIQRSDLPGAERLAAIAYLLGGTPLVTTAGAALMVAFARAGRRTEALFLLAVLVVRAGNWLLKAVADSPRPTPSLVEVTEQASGLGFPSSHVVSAVLLYGSIIYLAPRLVRSRPLRRLVVAVAAAAIAITGFGRIYTGAHWPSDVLGGYLWGTLLLLVVLWGYRLLRVRPVAVQAAGAGD